MYGYKNKCNSYIIVLITHEHTCKLLNIIIIYGYVIINIKETKNAIRPTKIAYILRDSTSKSDSTLFWNLYWHNRR